MALATPFRAGEEGRQTEEGEWEQRREQEEVLEEREGLELGVRLAETRQPEAVEALVARGKG